MVGKMEIATAIINLIAATIGLAVAIQTRKGD